MTWAECIHGRDHLHSVMDATFAIFSHSLLRNGERSPSISRSLAFSHRFAFILRRVISLFILSSPHLTGEAGERDGENVSLK